MKKNTIKTISFDVAPGVTIRGDAFGDASNPPVVLLHGGGQTRKSWGHTAEELANKGWYAIALDLRGHGESDWSPDGLYQNLHFAKDLEQVIEQLGGSAVAVGASLGGMTSMLLAGDVNPGMVSKLVLVDVTPTLDHRGVNRILGFMRAYPDGFASLDDAANVIAAYMPHRKRAKNHDGLKKNLTLGDDGRYHWHWDPKMVEEQNLQLDEEWMVAAAQKIKVPTLLVRGAMSDVVSEENVQRFQELVPHAKYVNVQRVGHMVAGDDNATFTDATTHFLEEASA